MQIVGEATAIRADEPYPAHSPWFDGARVTLVAARGETLGIQVLRHGDARVSLRFDGQPEISVHAFAVDFVRVARASTQLYGPSRGSGDYGDSLTPSSGSAITTGGPMYFEIEVGAGATASLHPIIGALTVGAKSYPVQLTISAVDLPPLPVEGVWAYEDPRELGWAGLGSSSLASPSTGELACIAMFRRYGVLLSPDIPLDAWQAREPMLAGVPDLPVTIPDDPAAAGDAVRAWIAATAGTHQLPFAIPIDEPGDAKTRARVRELASAVRAAGGGATTFRYAVTAAPNDDMGDAIDLYIAAAAAHARGDRYPRWTYNGKPPRAGTMVVDTAVEPGLRTWGWIGWRYQIPTWYVWDALYWHDRHDRAAAQPLPGRALAVGSDAVSFDDGEDHGNLDGVLALPGDAPAPCRPTLRLAALRRGLEDRAILDAAAKCDPAATAALAQKIIPRALADVGSDGDPSWPASDADFELARRDAIALAAGCANHLPR